MVREPRRGAGSLLALLRRMGNSGNKSTALSVFCCLKSLLRLQKPKLCRQNHIRLVKIRKRQVDSLARTVSFVQQAAREAGCVG